MEVNRRDTTRRAQIVRTVLDEIVHGASPVITIESLRSALGISPETAERIVDRLVSAGVLAKARTGVWVRIGR